MIFVVRHSLTVENSSERIVSAGSLFVIFLSVVFFVVPHFLVAVNIHVVYIYLFIDWLSDTPPYIAFVLETFVDDVGDSLIYQSHAGDIAYTGLATNFDHQRIITLEATSDVSPSIRV